MATTLVAREIPTSPNPDIPCQENQRFHSAFATCLLDLKSMKTLLIAGLLFFLVACAPISQTAANVSNFVVGTQVVSYQTDTETIAATIQSITGAMTLYSGYTPLVVSDVVTNGQSTEKIVVSAKALKGSVGNNVNAEDFSLEFVLVDQGGFAELTIRPSSASNDTARQAVTDYVAVLDKNFERVE